MKEKSSKASPAPAGTNVTVAKYGALLEKISDAFAAGQRRAALAINPGIVRTYWEIGRHIVEFEQGGGIHSEYGSKLLDKLSRDLTLRHGKGFSRGNLVYIRLLYIRHPIGQTLSDQLSWPHYVELLGIEDPLERGFYEKPSGDELRREIENTFRQAALEKRGQKNPALKSFPHDFR